MRPMRTPFEAALETVERMDGQDLEDSPPFALAFPSNFGKDR